MKDNKICIADSYKVQEALQQEFTDKICRFDASIEHQGNAIDQYVKDNSFLYYVSINSWLLLTTDIAGTRGSRILRDIITRHGLIQTVFVCNNASMDIINNVECLEPSITMLVAGLSKACSLQVLRYLKRLTVKSDLLERRALDGFFQTNAKCRVWPYNDDFSFTARIIRDTEAYLAKFFDGYTSPDFEVEGSFSSGACAHGKDEPPINTFDLKARDLLKRTGYYKSLLYQSPYSKLIPPRDSITPMAVPKTYKSARIIAPEDSYRQFCMNAMRWKLEKTFNKNGYQGLFNVHDQTASREMCFLGSLDGHLATVDFSAASDSISRALANRILPERVYNDAIRLLPRYFLTPTGQKRRARMLASAGSAITFFLEGSIFLAIALVATDLAQTFYEEVLARPVVYGDDCIIDARVYATFLCVAQALGFTISEPKSFASLDLLYREACGAEYEMGVDMSSIYFPRHHLALTRKNRDNCLNILVQHQHKICDFTETNMFIKSVIRRYIPDFTSHVKDTECDDLWEDIPVFGSSYAPGSDRNAVGNIAQAMRREKHYQLRMVADIPDKVKDRDVLSPVTELVRYVDFLEHGRKYEDNFLELLGCSSSYKDARDVYPGSPRYKLVSE